MKPTTEDHLAALRVMARFASAICKSRVEKVVRQKLPPHKYTHLTPEQRRHHEIEGQAIALMVVPVPLSEADYDEIVYGIAAKRMEAA